MHLSAIKEKKKGLETERDAIKAEEKKISKQIAQPRRKGAVFLSLSSPGFMAWERERSGP